MEVNELTAVCIRSEAEGLAEFSQPVLHTQDQLRRMEVNELTALCLRSQSETGQVNDSEMTEDSEPQPQSAAICRGGGCVSRSGRVKNLKRRIFQV